VSNHPLNIARRVTPESAMQADVTDAIRAAAPDRRRTGAAPWQREDVLKGRIAPCATLETCIDDALRAGTPADRVREIGRRVAQHIEMKIETRDGPLVAPEAAVACFVEASIDEQIAQGEADPHQIRATSEFSLWNLRRFLPTARMHRAKIDASIASAEIAERRLLAGEIAEARQRRA
jgi:hypothetical protein